MLAQKTLESLIDINEERFDFSRGLCFDFSDEDNKIKYFSDKGIELSKKPLRRESLNSEICQYLFEQFLDFAKQRKYSKVILYGRANEKYEEIARAAYNYLSSKLLEGVPVEFRDSRRFDESKRQEDNYYINLDAFIDMD
jgi:hypothetical protein